MLVQQFYTLNIYVIHNWKKHAAFHDDYQSDYTKTGTGKSFIEKRHIKNILRKSNTKSSIVYSSRWKESKK